MKFIYEVTIKEEYTLEIEAKNEMAADSIMFNMDASDVRKKAQHHDCGIEYGMN